MDQQRKKLLHKVSRTIKDAQEKGSGVRLKLDEMNAPPRAHLPYPIAGNVSLPCCPGVIRSVDMYVGIMGFLQVFGGDMTLGGRRACAYVNVNTFIYHKPCLLWRHNLTSNQNMISHETFLAFTKDNLVIRVSAYRSQDFGFNRRSVQNLFKQI